MCYLLCLKKNLKNVFSHRFVIFVIFGPVCAVLDNAAGNKKIRQREREREREILIKRRSQLYYAKKEGEKF